MERKCWECGNVAEHEDSIVPHVLCKKCGSQDTRPTKKKPAKVDPIPHDRIKLAILQSTCDERPKPVEVSGDLARRGEANGATTIRDLLELARAQEAMLFAYRIGRPPAEKTLATISRLKHLIQL